MQRAGYQPFYLTDNIAEDSEDDEDEDEEEAAESFANSVVISPCRRASFLVSDQRPVLKRISEKKVIRLKNGARREEIS